MCAMTSVRAVHRQARQELMELHIDSKDLSSPLPFLRGVGVGVGEGRNGRIHASYFHWISLPHYSFRAEKFAFWVYVFVNR